MFAFFGVAAVVGTAFVQVRSLTWLALAASVPVGLLACALLVINNLRDIPSDTAAGKRTLAVRIGDPRTRLLYAGCALVPFVAAVLIAPVRPLTLLTLAAVPLALPPVRAVLGGARRPGADRRARADGQAAARVRRAAHPRPCDTDLIQA